MTERDNLAAAALAPGIRTKQPGVIRKDDSYTKPLLPQNYAEAVTAHSKRGPGTTLFPGLNFENLALYLQRPYQPQNSGSRNPSLDPSQHPFPFVFVYSLLPSGQREISPIEKADDLPGPSAIARGEDAPSRILFLRGQPSAEWLTAIGASYLVDPEFFQRHLDFRSSRGRLDYYPLPSLPSTSHNIIRLRYFTVGQREGQSHGDNGSMLDALRQSSAKAMGRYLHNLNKGMDLDAGLGNSIVRSFTLHDETHFVLEQGISIFINPVSNGGWTVLVWLDTGNEVTEGPEGPWMRLDEHEPRNRTSFYPTIQIQPQIALRSHKLSITPEKKQNTRYLQSASLLHIDYGKNLDQQLIACDPFYAMHELFSFCAFSEVQFLNLVQSKLTASTGYRSTTKQSWTQSDFLYTKDILEVHASRLREELGVIKARGGPSWPRPPDTTLLQKSRATVQIIEKDFEYLLHRTEALSLRCTAGMDVLMNGAMIAESAKAITQAREVTKVTRLAFVYIPLSFTASFFGMNLRPLTQDGHSLWLWFAVSVLVLFASLAPLLWDLPGLWERLTSSTKQTA